VRGSVKKPASLGRSRHSWTEPNQGARSTPSLHLFPTAGLSTSSEKLARKHHICSPTKSAKMRTLQEPIKAVNKTATAKQEPK
jgi:hypothetical protein